VSPGQQPFRYKIFVKDYETNLENEAEKLFELAPDDLYIGDICRTFEKRQLAVFSQAFFELLALTAAFFEKLRGSDWATRNIQIAEQERTHDKRKALSRWQYTYISNSLNHTFGLLNAINKNNPDRLKADLQDFEPARNFISNRELNNKLTSRYTELGAIFTILREAINQDSHTSSITLGGGIMVSAGPLKLVEVAENIASLSEKLASHEIFHIEEYKQDGTDLIAKINNDCRPALAEFKSLINAAEVKRLLLKGINDEAESKETRQPERMPSGDTKTSHAFQDSEIRTYIGNLVELISKNNSALKEEISDSSLLLTEVIERAMEKSINSIKEEVSSLSNRMAPVDSKVSRELKQSGDYPQNSRPTSLLMPVRTNGKITENEAKEQLELLKQEIMREARRHFSRLGKSVEYYHCIVNRTMYEAFLYNRITDVRSIEAADFIKRLITSRNPRHVDLIEWQIEKYGSAINSILNKIEYPLTRNQDIDDDEIPF